MRLFRVTRELNSDVTRTPRHASPSSDVTRSVDVPADLEHVKSLNWEHIDRKDIDYFELGVTKICKAAGLGEQ